MGQAEKYYFQDIILFILNQEYGKNLIFKGGTALRKCYGLDRFSEDLDFTCLKKVDLKKLETDLKRFDLDYDIRSSNRENDLRIFIRIKGPLYINSLPQSTCKIQIDFSYRENIIIEPSIKRIGMYITEIPTFEISVMNEIEILAEKIRAIWIRSKARDMYDLMFLLKKGIPFEEDLVNKKLSIYNHSWDPKIFEEKLRLKRDEWEIELEPLLRSVPNFEETRQFILEKILR
jgi:predicted nucleotidyltransferase component of viral defense system